MKNVKPEEKLVKRMFIVYNCKLTCFWVNFSVVNNHRRIYLVSLNLKLDLI